MKLTSICAWSLTLCCATSLAFAGPGKPGGQGPGKGKPGPGGNAGQRDPGQMFGRMDKDGNGVLSKNEVPERMQAHFDKLDADGNGGITREELVTAMKNRPGQGAGPGGKGKPEGARGGEGMKPEGLLKRLDADGNGSISKNEAPENMQARFDKMDADGNGSIDLNEIKTMMERRAEAGAKKGGKPSKE